MSLINQEAAKDLYEALKWARQTLFTTRIKEDAPVIQAIDAALDKAEGKPPKAKEA